jgi:HSP20 family protein
MNYQIAHPHRRVITSKRPAHVPTPTLTSRFNTLEHAEYWKIQLAVPGFDKEDLQITLDQQILVVKSVAKKQDNQATPTVKTHLNEWTQKAIDVNFHLPTGTDMEAIQADCAQGILTITLPKKKATSINIK